MLGNSHFYHRTIRKVVVAFGSIFNDITLNRYNKDGTIQYEHFKVPLSYGSKEKYLTRITSDPNLTKSIAAVVPRISFEMTGMNYDSSRKMQSTLRNFSANTSTSMKTQFAPVPYDFEFSVSVYVRNTEDGTQILEQILPFFTPDFNVTIDFVPDMDQKYDLPIKLNSVSTSTDYEGDMMSTRLILWDLSFTAKGYIWPPIKSGKIIRSANTNIYINLDEGGTAQKVYVDFANGTGVFATSEVIRVVDRDINGRVVYFSNSNAGILIVDSLSNLLEVGDKVTGDYSNSSFTIKTTDVVSINAAAIVVVPKPISAEPDDEYGFTETIKEWPNT